MTSAEMISAPKPPMFITTASGRAGKEDLARNAGYSLLPPDLYYFAQAASRREDVLSDYLRLGVVGHLYKYDSAVPTSVSTTVQAAVNKNLAAGECFEGLRKTHPSKAISLTGQLCTTHDNQRVLVETDEHKIAFKKIRTGSLQEQVEDIERIIDAMKMGAHHGDKVEFSSVFVESVFGHPTKMAIKTVRTRVGKLLPLDDIQTQLMASLIANNAHITGGLDIDELMSNFVDATEINILVRQYELGAYHFVEYKGESLMIVESLVQDKAKDRAIVLPRDFNLNQRILPELVRGFTGSLI